MLRTSPRPFHGSAAIDVGEYDPTNVLLSVVCAPPRRKKVKGWLCLILRLKLCVLYSSATAWRRAIDCARTTLPGDLWLTRRHSFSRTVKPRTVYASSNSGPSRRQATTTGLLPTTETNSDVVANISSQGVRDVIMEYAAMMSENRATSERES